MFKVFLLVMDHWQRNCKFIFVPHSDHYITEVLMRAAPRVKTGSAPMRDAYRSAAKSISSETYYGRALRAIE